MIDIIAPFEQEGTRAVVRGWLKNIGDRVDENDPLLELETDKVTQEVPAPAAGVLAEILLDVDAEAAPGTVLGRLRPATGAVAARALEAPASPRSAAKAAPARDIEAETEMRLSPASRRAVREHGLDPRNIAGSGRGGRITRADVDAAAAAGEAAPAAPSPARSHSVPHDSMRRRIARNMHASLSTAPHVTAVFEADMGAVMAHRAAHKAAFAERGVNLTVTAYLIAACAEAMQAAPAINSRWHDDRLEIFDDINIGVGTALGEGGLVVPVVRGVQDLALSAIAERLQDLIGRARENRLKPADVQGGTFSISNHGVSGSLLAAPIIINQPQSAILGVGKLEKRLVVREMDGADAVRIRPMCYVSLTIDHRVVDAHQTNLWLARFTEVLESWPTDG